jgi:hypothetical protein
VGRGERLREECRKGGGGIIPGYAQHVGREMEGKVLLPR